MVSKIVKYIIIVYALSAIELRAIDSLESGSCWYEKSDWPLKVVSFPEGDAYEVGDSLLTILREEVDYEDAHFYLHCSSSGMYVVARVVGQGRQYMVWFKWNSTKLVVAWRGEILLKDQFPSAGVDLKKLYVATDLGPEELKGLVENHLGTSVKIERSFGHTYIYFFDDEESVYTRIEKLSGIKGVRYIDPIPFQAIRGSFIKF